MLLTAVGRAENSGAKYYESHDQQLEIGHGPILVEIIEAVIEIETDKKNLRVFSINPQGFIIGYIPAKYENGVLKFEIGKEYQSMYYLIQALLTITIMIRHRSGGPDNTILLLFLTGVYHFQ